MEFEEWDLEEQQDLPDIVEEEDVAEDDDIPEEIQIALLKSPLDRTDREAELVDIYRHPNYMDQISFATDDTGAVLRDANGDLVHCPRNTPGSHRPDGFYEDELGGIHIREVKNSKNTADLELLKGDIANQAYKRNSGFGKESDITFVLPPPFSIEQADELHDFAEGFLNVNLEFVTK